MKFDEMISNKNATKKVNTLKIVIIVVVAITIFLVLYFILKGVFGGNELLEFNTHPNYTGKIVSVIGGGNVAMDCARTIKKLRSKTSKCHI